MAKLIYVHNDDGRVFDVLVHALQDSGYAPEYSLSEQELTAKHIRADVALFCPRQSSPRHLTVADITLDLDNVTAYNAENQSIHFTPIEFSMLSYLMKNAHRAVPRSELLTAVWGYENSDGSRVADDTAKRLRRKLKDSLLVLETVWNYGFRVRAK